MSVKGKQVKLTAADDETHAPSDGKSEWLERGDHPLLNDLILERLFGFVRRYDLKTCRVVSKNWNLRTVSQMRLTFKVTILGSQPAAEAMTDQETRRIDNFVELFSSNTLGIPFAKFQLGPFLTTEGVGQQFLQLSGETATEIDLNDRKKEVYRIEDVSEILRCCSNLETLELPFNPISRSGNIVKLFPDSMQKLSSLKKITFDTNYEKDRLKFCPSFIDELFTAAPNISNISVFDSLEDREENEDEDNGRNIHLILNCIEKLGRESSIQSLFLDRATINDIEHLQRMGGLKLKRLTIRPNAVTGVDLGDLDTVQIKLATCFRDTLEYFEVNEDVDNILMEFPNMPKLKSLNQGIIPNFDVRAVNLSDNFPALETLNINFDQDDNWDEFFSEFDPCPIITIKSLIVEENYMKVHMFHNFLIIFPNLTKLSLRVKDDDGFEVVRQVWTLMTQLESLIISSSVERTVDFYFDSLFTGIPTQGLKSILHVVNGLEEMTVEKRGETILKLRNDHCRLPSILNLTKLRYLELTMTGDDFHLTDITAYLAFYSMNRLNHLDIQQCEFTKTCCEILTKETGLETWNFEILKNEKSEHIIPPFLLPNRDTYIHN